MIDGATCPYCGKEQEINHDDGYGYEEDEVYQQECGHCGKTFVYTTGVLFVYSPEKAPCLNGSEHEWVDIVGSPEEYFVGKQRCRVCDERREIDKESG